MDFRTAIRDRSCRLHDAGEPADAPGERLQSKAFVAPFSLKPDISLKPDRITTG